MRGASRRGRVRRESAPLGFGQLKWATWLGVVQRESRLRQNAEFQRVRRQGRPYAHPLAVLYARRAAGAPTRTGISVSKRVGKAVVRNRAKRLIREALRLHHRDLAAGWELLFVARPGIVGASFREVAEAIDQSLRRAGVVPGETASATPARQGPSAQPMSQPLESRRAQSDRIPSYQEGRKIEGQERE